MRQLNLPHIWRKVSILDANDIHNLVDALLSNLCNFFTFSHSQHSRINGYTVHTVQPTCSIITWIYNASCLSAATMWHKEAHTCLVCLQREMTGNGFLYSHSLPFTGSQFLFPFLAIPKFKFYFHYHGIPLGYFHFHPFPQNAQRNNKVRIQAVDSRATEK